MKKTEEGGLIQGFHVGPINSTGICISHLLFVDDTILFYDASREQMLSIRLVLTCFQAFTGLEVNVGTLASILQYMVGGLGIWNLVSFYQALLGKWLWRYGHEFTHLWRRVIAVKYEEGKGGWCTRVCRRAHGCGLWQSIREGWDTFSKHLSFVVGDGSHILF